MTLRHAQVHTALLADGGPASLKATGQMDSSAWHICGWQCHGWLDWSLQAANEQLKLVAVCCGDAHMHTQHATRLMQISLKAAGHVNGGRHLRRYFVAMHACSTDVLCFAA